MFPVSLTVVVLKLANAQCPPLPRDSADRGDAVGGGVRKRFMVELRIVACFFSLSASQLSSLNTQLNKTALRLWVNPFGSVEPLPLYRADAATQRKTFAVAAYG